MTASISHDEERVNLKIGQRMRYIRLLRGWTQCELAQHMSISVPQLHKYETGRNRISAAKLAILGELLNVPVTEFLNFQGAPNVMPRYLSEESAELQQLCQAYRSLETHLQQAQLNLLLSMAYGNQP